MLVPSSGVWAPWGWTVCVFTPTPLQCWQSAYTVASAPCRVLTGWRSSQTKCKPCAQLISSLGRVFEKNYSSMVSLICVVFYLFWREKKCKESGSLKKCYFFQIHALENLKRPFLPLGIKQGRWYYQAEAKLAWIIQSSRKSSCSSFPSLIVKGGEWEGSSDNTRGEGKINWCPKPHKL